MENWNFLAKTFPVKLLADLLMAKCQIETSAIAELPNASFNATAPITRGFAHNQVDILVRNAVAEVKEALIVKNSASRFPTPVVSETL